MSNSRDARLWGAVLVVSVVLGIASHWPVISSGYLMDDYLQNAMQDGTYPLVRPPYDLYTFGRPGPELHRLVDGSALPWWSHPNLRLSAFRPLSSLTLAFDYHLGLSPLARHIHSQIWWVALVCAFGLLVRGLLPLGAACSAVFMFAVDPSRVIPLSWIANRPALICAFFGILGLRAHVRWREESRPRGALISALFWSIALLGGEYGVCAPAYALSYELFARRDPWSERLRALVPAAVPTAVYLGASRPLGFGVSANWLYLNPLATPGEFFLRSVSRFPALLANELFQLPSELTNIMLTVNYSAIGYLIVPMLLVAWLTWGTLAGADARTNRMLRFLAAGMLLSLLPLMATLPSARLLVIPTIGGSALLGAFLWDAWERIRGRVRLPVEWSALRFVRIVSAVVLFGIHVAAGTWLAESQARAADDRREAYRKFCLQAPIDDLRIHHQDLAIINSLDVLQTFYLPYARHEHGSPMPKSWQTLALSFQPVRVLRTAPDTLELSVSAGSLLDNPQTNASRAGDLPYAPGETVELPQFQVQILDVGPFGPTRARFRFHRVLEDPSLELLVVTELGLIVFIPPPVGTDVVVQPRLAVVGPL